MHQPCRDLTSFGGIRIFLGLVWYDMDTKRKYKIKLRFSWFILLLFLFPNRFLCTSCRIFFEYIAYDLKNLDLLGFECLESTAFNGISANLVVYLHNVLHGSNASNAANAATWSGTSYFTPLVGALIADTYWGNYKTILISLTLYLLVCENSNPSSLIPKILV